MATLVAPAASAAISPYPATQSSLAHCGLRGPFDTMEHAPRRSLRRWVDPRRQTRRRPMIGVCDGSQRAFTVWAKECGILVAWLAHA